MESVAKSLIFIGGSIFILGLILLVFGKVPGVGKLPGDIYIKKENMSFYFPITTCIILSILITLILRLWNKS